MTIEGRFKARGCGRREHSHTCHLEGGTASDKVMKFPASALSARPEVGYREGGDGKMRKLEEIRALVLILLIWPIFPVVLFR